MNVVEIPCDTTNNACVIPVKAPGFALVFFNSDDESANLGQATSTFTTSAHDRMRNTATVDLAVLATSNGQSGKERHRWGSTSKGIMRNGEGRRVSGGVLSLSVFGGGVMAGAIWLATMI